MWRFLILLLVMLLSCGCSRAVIPETTAPVVTTEDSPDSLYVLGSDVEKETGGAVRMYRLDKKDYVGIGFAGEQLLLVSDNGDLTALTGSDCIPVATDQTGLNQSGIQYTTGKIGVAYYREDSREVVLLNPLLQQVNRVAMPENMDGTPVVSLEENTIFYCAGDEIRGLEIETGISRLVKQQYVESQQLLGSFFNGSMLACRVVDEQGEETVHYLLSENGLTVWEDDGFSSFSTNAEQFFLQRLDGTVEQTIFGNRNAEEFQLLTPEESPEETLESVLVSALPLNGAVSCNEIPGSLTLSFYDFTTGKQTAKTSLSNIQCPVAIGADSQYVWFLAADEQNTQFLYRWDIGSSAVDNETVFTQPLYTADNPDEKGLALRQERAAELGDKWGVRFSLWQDALAYGDTLPITAEYRTVVIDELFESLEPILSQFPDNFLKKTVENGWIRICPVRSLETESWAQLWFEGDCCIFLTPESDAAEAVLRGIAYGIDSRVLGNSKAYDNWSNLNPDGVIYGQIPEQMFLEGENRCFADETGGDSPLEDRVGIFARAMSAGANQYFESSTMQNKLRRMCEGIRDAYGLENHQEPLLWEQYLDTPIDDIKE